MVPPSQAKENRRKTGGKFHISSRWTQSKQRDQDTNVAHISRAELGIGPGLVLGVGEVGGLIPYVRWFVIRRPFLKRAFWRDDRLEAD